MSEENPKEEQEYKEELIAIFKEHWNHARHCENERLWFTNIYAIVVAAILVFIGNVVFGESPDYGSAILLALFGFILSVIGFLIVVALLLGYQHHITDIDMVFYYWNKMEFYRHPPKPVHFGTAHRWFFEITIALFAVLLLSFHEHPSPSILVFIIIFILAETMYQLTWKRYSSECIDLRTALRKETNGFYRHKWDNWSKYANFRKKIIEDAREKGHLQKEGYLKMLLYLLIVSALSGLLAWLLLNNFLKSLAISIAVLVGFYIYLTMSQKKEKEEPKNRERMMNCL